MIACCAIYWEQPRPDIKANCPYLTFHLTEKLAAFISALMRISSCESRALANDRFAPIVLQKSIFADDQNSADRGRDFRVQDVRDLTASRKIHRRLR